VVESEDSDTAENLEASLTRAHSLFHYAELGSALRPLM
jgi:hypothetical protein